MEKNEEFKPLEAEIRNKEIDLIQSVITRMEGNQFKIKGFCVITLGFILYGLQGKFLDTQLFAASMIVVFGCYFLDLRYLQAEKLYKMWFDFLQRKRSETREWLYLLNPISIKAILNEQSVIWKEFDVKEIKQNINNFYFYVFLIICIFYLPTIINQLNT